MLTKVLIKYNIFTTAIYFAATISPQAQTPNCGEILSYGLWENHSFDSSVNNTDRARSYFCSSAVSGSVAANIILQSGEGEFSRQKRCKEKVRNITEKIQTQEYWKRANSSIIEAWSQCVSLASNSNKYGFWVYPIDITRQKTFGLQMEWNPTGNAGPVEISSKLENVSCNQVPTKVGDQGATLSCKVIDKDLDGIITINSLTSGVRVNVTNKNFGRIRIPSQTLSKVPEITIDWSGLWFGNSGNRFRYDVVIRQVGNSIEGKYSSNDHHSVKGKIEGKVSDDVLEAQWTRTDAGGAGKTGKVIWKLDANGASASNPNDIGSRWTLEKME